MNRKRPPIGIENFEDMVTHDFYYVDKTGMIQNLLENWGEVNLFTRPRRFGKSLTISMLKTFFEIGTNPTLFEGLAISKQKDLCDKFLGKYPVIMVSLKDVRGLDFESARNELWTVIKAEATRFDYLQDNGTLRIKISRI